MLRRLFILWVLLMLLGNIRLVAAHDVLQGDQCAVAAGEQIVGDVFVLCRNLTVSGEIDGNLFGVASTSLIDGKVTGSVYLAGGQLDVSGSIGNTLHFAGGVLNLKPSAQLDNDLITVSFSTQTATSIPGSVTAVGYQLLIGGKVEREISFWGSALTVDSTVTGDVTANVGDPASTGVTQLQTLLKFLRVDLDLVNPGLRVTKNGMIHGYLRYSGPTEGEIVPKLAHPPEFTQVTAQTDLTIPSQQSFGERLRDYAVQAVRELVSLLLVGGVGLLLIPRRLQAPIVSLRMRPLPSLGVGLVTFIISFFIAAVIILLSLVLVLLLFLLQLGDLSVIGGVFIMLFSMGGISLFYFTAIFVSRVIVAIALGRILVRLVFGDRRERYMTYVSLLFGALVLALLSALPLVGWLVIALAVFFGLGAMLTLVQSQLDRTRAARAMPHHPQQARQLPPPSLDDTPALGPGMENLPEGFHWWK